MGLFGARKKEEATKEWEDIQQIKEAIEPADVSVSKVEAPLVVEQWTKGGRGSRPEISEQPEQPEQSEQPAEWSTQQFSMSAPSPMPMPKVEALQTPNIAPNISRATTWTATVPQKSLSEIPSDVPLFIKLDRYKNILHTISDLKQTVTKVKNAFAMFSEMERAKAENLRVLEAAVQKVEARIVDLDSEFIKPAGLVETEQQEGGADENSAGGDEGLHGMISDLRVQIDKLKEELEQLGAEEKEILNESPNES